MPGNLVLQSSTLFIVALNVTPSAKADVGGTASLGGALQEVLLPLPVARQTTIVHSAGLEGTTFSSFTVPAGFTGTLTYTPTDVISTLTANLGAGTALTVNQQNVATSLNSFFNEHALGNARPVTDLVNLFGRLKSHGFKIGLATMDSAAAAEAQLSAFGVRGLMDFVCGYDSGFGHQPGPGRSGCGAQGRLRILRDLEPGRLWLFGHRDHARHPGWR